MDCMVSAVKASVLNANGFRVFDCGRDFFAALNDFTAGFSAVHEVDDLDIILPAKNVGRDTRLSSWYRSVPFRQQR